jgi:hypothetical protein
MATSLYIENNLIELEDNGSIPIVQSVADINNLFGANTKGSYSIPFSVPATKDNKKFFKFPELITDDSFDGNVEKPARLEVDGTIILDGVARIKSIAKNGDISEYKIILYDNNSSWINDRKGQLLTDIDWSDYNHNWSVENIRNSEILDDENFYLYPLINYGKPEGYPNWRITDRLAHFRVWKIFLKIFEESGYQVESEFINSDFFKRLFISPTGIAKLDEDVVTNNRFFVKMHPDTIFYAPLSPNTDAIPCDIDYDFGGESFFNTSTNDYDTTNYRYVSSVDAKMAFSFNCEIVKARFGGLFPESKNSEVYFHLFVNGIEVDKRTKIMDSIGFRFAGFPYSFSIDFNPIPVYDGDVVSIHQYNDARP